MEQLSLIFIIAIIQAAVVGGLGFIIKIIYNDFRHIRDTVSEHHSTLFGNPHDPTHKGIAYCVDEIKNEITAMNIKLDEIKRMVQ